MGAGADEHLATRPVHEGGRSGLPSDSGVFAVPLKKSAADARSQHAGDLAKLNRI